MQSENRPPTRESTVGILLAGGRAARMGGGDKALKMLGGVSLLARVIAILRAQCESLVLNANGTPARFKDFALPVVADDVGDFAGPLAGILAGLDCIAAQSPEADFALSAPADTPFLPADLVARLHAARGGADIVCARSGGIMHPVVALWPIGIRSALRQALVDEELRKVTAFIARYRLAYADWPFAPFDPFLNINTPDDLATAERILKRYGDPPVTPP